MTAGLRTHTKASKPDAAILSQTSMKNTSALKKKKKKLLCICQMKTGNNYIKTSKQ